MVARIEEYDGMEALAYAVPELMLHSTTFCPAPAAHKNFEFPSKYTTLI